MKTTFAVVYTNLFTHAIYFHGAFDTIEKAREALGKELENFYLWDGTWEFVKSNRGALVLDTTTGTPVKHGRFSILEH